MKSEKKMADNEEERCQKGKRFKVWCYDKSVGKVLLANNLADLVEKAKAKLGISDPIKLVLEDNCEIDDDDALSGIIEMTSLYAVTPTQELTLPSTSGNHSDDRLKQVMNTLKKRKIEFCKKPRSMTTKFIIGWFNFNPKMKRYVNVRSQKGGGIQTVEIMSNVHSMYDEILNQMKEHFFPGGKSPLGKVTNFEFTIGDGKGTIIRETSNIQDYKRVNLMSKQKTFSLESDSDSDFDLPAINITKRDHKSPRKQALPVHKRPKTATATNPHSVVAFNIAQPSIEMPIQQSVHFQEGVGHNSQDLLDISGPMMDLINSPKVTQMPETSLSISPPTTSFCSTGTPTVDMKIEKKCIVCYDRSPSAFYFPCGHTSCLPCAIHLDENGSKCPHCRHKIVKVCSIFND